MKIIDAFIKTLLVAAGCLFAATAFAQQWPARAVRIIVPFPPGQAADINARIIAERLSPVLGQQVVIDNPAAGAWQVSVDPAVTVASYFEDSRPIVSDFAVTAVAGSLHTIALTVAVGDKVIFGKYSGQTVKLGADELLVLREEDLFALIVK